MPDSPVIIVGSSGQDGKLLAKSLASQEEPRSIITINRDSLNYLGKTRPFSIFSRALVLELVSTVKPYSVYYLCAHHQSSEEDLALQIAGDYDLHHSVHVSGLLNFLNAIHTSSPDTKIFYASSSLIFSGSFLSRQTEDTPFSPVGLYGITKAQGTYLCRYFRETYGTYVSTGILYTHESTYRSSKFLVRKLIDAAIQIKHGQLDFVQVGSLDAVNDWGYAPDYVRAFQLILNLPLPSDFIVATGEARTVRELCETIFSSLGLDYRSYVVLNPDLSRRVTEPRIGDYSRLKMMTGWHPSLDFNGMIQKLTHDLLEGFG